MPRSGREEFRAVMRNARRPYAWLIIISTLAPVVTLVIELGPARSSVVGAITSVIVWTVYVCAFRTWTGERYERLRSKGIFAMALLGISILLFICLAFTEIPAHLNDGDSLAALTSRDNILRYLVLLSWLSIWGNLCAVICAFVLAHRRRHRRSGRRTYHRPRPR